MKAVDIICLNCNENSKAPLREVNRGNGKFCGHSCASSYNGYKRFAKINKPNVICAYCDIKFYKNASKRKLSKSGLYFCCRGHKDLSQRIGGIKEIQPPHYGTTLQDYRSIAFAVYKKLCMRCGYMKHSAAIIVHHKDRDRSNNNISNLEVLCCNCHAIEHYG